MKETTLSEECRYYEDLIDFRLRGFIPPKTVGVAEKVFKIICAQAHREERMKLDSREEQDIILMIDHHISRGTPIPITLSLAIGLRVNNSLKYREFIHFPSLGWIHFGYFFKSLQKKVKMVYRPGVKIIVFDEATLLSRFFDIEAAYVEKFLKSVRGLFQRIDAPIAIVEMSSEKFPSSEVEKMPVKVNDAQIYAAACSFPQMKERCAMDYLYRQRKRDYGQIREFIGEELWSHAERTSKVVAQHLAYRKSVNMFAEIVGAPFLDACITDKNKRIVFDITSPALINHGMPVVSRGLNGSYRLQIIPEYRIAHEFSNAKPIKISAKEFGDNEDLFTFYYEVERR